MAFNLDDELEQLGHYEITLGGKTWHLPYMQNLPVAHVRRLQELDKRTKELHTKLGTAAKALTLELPPEEIEDIIAEANVSDEELELLSDSIYAPFEVIPELYELMRQKKVPGPTVAKVMMEWQRESNVSLGESLPSLENLALKAGQPS